MEYRKYRRKRKPILILEAYQTEIDTELKSGYVSVKAYKDDFILITPSGYKIPVRPTAFNEMFEEVRQ